MKLYLEREDGTKIEVKEIEAIKPDSKLIILKTNTRLRPVDMEQIEKIYTDKFGTRCVIVDSMIDKVLGV